MLIYKLIHCNAWDEARRLGHFAGAPVDLADGYIHFSDAGTIEETAQRHFAGQDDLLILAVPADALGPDLRWEVSRGGKLSHLYAPLAVEAVVWARPLPLAPDGRHVFPGP